MRLVMLFLEPAGLGSGPADGEPGESGGEARTAKRGWRLWEVCKNFELFTVVLVWCSISQIKHNACFQK
jgi:hypothetical protein